MSEWARLKDLPRENAEEKLREDPLFFIESCLYVSPKAGGIIPFRLNDEQLKVLNETIWPLWTKKEPVRIIVLKARQLGISTLIQGFLYWMASTRSHIKTLTLAHRVDSAQSLLSISTRFAIKDERHRLGMMPMMANVNKQSITLDNPDWRSRVGSPGLESEMAIGTAENQNAGRSETIQAFHASEAAYYRHPEILGAVLPAVPNYEGTFCALESTANGASGLFYDTWEAAVEGRNEWTPVFLSWKGRPEYRIRLKSERRERYDYTHQEEKLVEAHGLTCEEIEWRRRTIAGATCQGTSRDPEDVFKEIYPLTPEEAFVGSGRTYFDVGAVMQQEKVAKDIAYVVGSLEGPGEEVGVRTKQPHVRFRVDNAGFIRIWEPPVEGNDYVIGADVGAGLRGGDYSVAYVLHRASQRFVARIRAQIDPERYKRLLVLLAWYYNEAFLAAEANSIGIEVARYISSHYSRSAYYVKLDQFGFYEPDPERPGWYTTAKNRLEMVGEIRRCVNGGECVMPDLDFFAEAKNFVVPQDSEGKILEARPRAKAGKKDDCIMAGAITIWVNRPMFGGPIRRPKEYIAPAKTWLEAAMREDLKNERQPKIIYDEHIGMIGTEENY